MGKIINMNKNTGDTLTAGEFNNVISSINLTYEDITNNDFVAVNAIRNTFTIDFSQTPYSEITLGTLYSNYNLNIINYAEGDCGKIIVNQSGFRTLVAENIQGTIDLPIATNTQALITYYVNEGVLYAYCTTIIANDNKQLPSTITDLLVVYSNLLMCMLQWTSPSSGVDGVPVTSYDIRYSASPLENPDTVSTWSSATNTNLIITPAAVGSKQTAVLTNLKANLEYYVYIKSNKVTNGVTYTSSASNYAYFVTKGSTDTSTYYLIPLTTDNIYALTTVTGTDEDGNTVDARKLIVDELDKTKYISNGYPDTSLNGIYSTSFGYNEYSRALIMPYLIFDLKTIYTLDKAYITSGNKGTFRVYCTDTIGGDWDYVGMYTAYFSNWIIVDFLKKKVRLFKIAWDTIYSNGSGEYTFPSSSDYNGDICPIANILLYGNSDNQLKVEILPPKRHAFLMRTVDDFFCVDGHAYQQGRIHSMISGPKIRLYIHYGQFDAYDDNGNIITPSFKDITDVKFRFNDIGWITGNNGTGLGLVGLLRDTYAKYGMKPYLTATGYSAYTRYSSSINGRPIDDYWLPGVWKPVPKLELDGFIPYYNATQNASHYMTQAKLCYNLAAKFGSKKIDASKISDSRNSSSTVDENATDSGLDLISGLEPGNEINQTWSEFSGYANNIERFALDSACYDGICNTMIDVSGQLVYGTKNADPDLLFINPGNAGIETQEPFEHYFLTIKTRSDKSIPYDATADHIYCTNPTSTGAATFEDWMLTLNGLFLNNYIDFRDRYYPSTEIWINEFGYGEGGIAGGEFLCYSQPGITISGWTIPDRFRSDVKGAWTIRACIRMMSAGITLINYYSTEMEENAFDTGQYGGGIGYEMYHWNDTTSTTPGAKVAAVAPYVINYTRSQFSGMGIFGNFLDNGAFPITRSYWYLATFRNTLKNYYFVGYKSISSDSKIIIACFKKKDDDTKGAYVIYYNTAYNLEVHNISVPVPSNVTSVTHVTTYVPDLIDPTTVPQSVLYASGDVNRTGMVRATHTIVSGVETVTLPTKEQNPYFPLVGPVAAQNINKIGGNATYGANAFYETKLDNDGNTTWVYHEAAALAWNQVEAICDYIEYSDEGKHGTTGDSTTIDATGGFFITDATEFPEYYLFDAVPTTDFNSKVTNLISNVISSDTVDLFWNNNNVEDTAYEVLQSISPETGYSVVDTVTVSAENTDTISGLSPNTTYYFKVIPLRNSDQGQISDYVSAKTLAVVTAPTNLQMSNIGLTGITLSWSGDYTDQTDFISYLIYRAIGTGSYTQIASIKDRTIKTYLDSNLTSGTYYSYKIKVLTENGVSNYSNIVTNRTLLTTETSPSVKKAYTNKIGTLIIVEFDIDLTLSNQLQVLNNLSLTEDGSFRSMKSCSLDTNNLNILVISILDGTLAQYTERTQVLLSYTTNSNLVSKYGITVSGFTNQVVSNLVGNYTNINGIYRINFASVSSTDVPIDTTWNSLVGDPSTAYSSTSLNGMLNVSSSYLVDEYYRTSTIQVTPITQTVGSITYNWNGSRNGYGNLCTISGIPFEVKNSLWYINNRYDSSGNQILLSRLQLTGLNSSYTYDIQIYGMWWWNENPANNRYLQMYVNGVYSNIMDVTNNANQTAVLELINPTADGVINIDFNIPYSNYLSLGGSRPINFMILTEYTNYGLSLQHEPYLISAVLNDNKDLNPTDNIIDKLTSSIHIATIGEYTNYMLSESSTFDSAVWTYIDSNSEYDLPFTLTSWGVKTLYVKLKNSIGESNVKSITFSAILPQPISINSLIINNGALVIDDPLITVETNTINLEATNYKISEYNDFRDSQVLSYSNPITFTTTSDLGLHTIYVAVSSDGGTTWANSASTTFILSTLLLNQININSGDTTSVYATVNVSGAYIGNPTYYYLSEDYTFSNTVQQPFSSFPISYTFNTGGSHTLYLKLKNRITTTTTVSAQIIYDYSVSNVSFTVTVPSYVNTDNVNLSIPALKYDKRFAYSDTVDDSYTIYNFMVCPFRGRSMNIANGQWSLWYHTDGSGNDAVSSYGSDPGETQLWNLGYAIQYTDGCGIEKLPHVTVATWPSIDTANYMLNTTVDWLDMLDFGHFPAYHDVWDAANNNTTGPTDLSTYNTLLSDSEKYIYNLIGVYLKTQITPNGDINLLNWAKNNLIIQLNQGNQGVWTYPFSSTFSLDKNVNAVTRNFTDVVTEYNNIVALTQKDPIYRQWEINGQHRQDYNKLGFFEQFHKMYLGGGTDTFWCPSLDEMYEYWYYRSHVNFTKSVDGLNITFTANVPNFDNFYYPELSVLLSDIYSPSSKVIDTLRIQGVAACGGTCTITRNNRTLVISYNEGDTAELIAALIRLSTSFTDATLTGSNNKCVFTESANGIINYPTFIDASGKQQQVVYTFTNGTTNAGVLTFNIDFTELSLTYTAQSNLTATLLCDYIKQAFTSKPCNSWSLDTTRGTKTLVFTSNIFKTSGTPTFTDTGSTGATAMITLTQVGLSMSGIKGYWNRSIDGLSVTSNNQGLNYGVDSNSQTMIDGYSPILINLNWGNLLLTRALKYVSRYETKQDTQSLIDARYFIDQLADNDIKTGFINRINVYALAPTLLSISINSGDTTTTSNTVTIGFTVVSGTPTYYKLSESPSFVNASWLQYTSNVSFTLSNVLGNHTIYAKVKNGNGGSNSVNDSIDFEVPTLVLSSMSINGGAATTTTKAVTVSYVTVGSSPTYYMINEDPLFTSSQWIPITPTIPFTLSAGSSTKTVYLKMKNDYYTTSTISGLIIYNNTFDLGNIVINSGDSYSNDRTVSIRINYTGDTVPTGYKLSELSDLTDVSGYTTWVTNTVPYTFNSYGNKTLYCLITDGTHVSSIQNDSITIAEQLLLTGMSINNGDKITSVSNVNIAVSYIGTPTSYMISEDNTFTNSSWTTFTTSAISYTLRNYTEPSNIWGTHELYVKLTDGLLTTSYLKSTIMATYSALNNILLANISSDITNSPYGYINSMSNSYGSNKQYHSSNGALSGSYYAPNINQNWYEVTPGFKWYPDMLGGLLSDMSNLNPVPADTVFTSNGYYPNNYIWNSTSKYSNTLNVWHNIDSTVSGTYCTSYEMATLPSGTYKVRLLFNAPNFYGSQLRVKCNSAPALTISVSNHTLYCNNSDNWLTFNNIDISGTGDELSIMFNDSTTTPPVSYTSLLSFIEITQQNYIDPGFNIQFADPIVKLILVNSSINSDGNNEISTVEAAAVTDNMIGRLFHDTVSGAEITTFNEFKYFTGLTSIGENAFLKCSKLTEITLPPNLQYIYNDIAGYTAITNLTIPGSVQQLWKLLYLPTLTHIIFLDSSTPLLLHDNSMFKSDSSMTTLVLPARTNSLASDFLGYCNNIKLLYVKSTTPPSLLGDIGGSLTNIYVPSGCATAYQAATYWSNKSSIISEYTSIPSEYDTVSTY